MLYHFCHGEYTTDYYLYEILYESTLLHIVVPLDLCDTKL